MGGIYSDEEIAENLRLHGFADGAEVIERLLREEQEVTRVITNTRNLACDFLVELKAELATARAALAAAGDRYRRDRTGWEAENSLLRCENSDLDTRLATADREREALLGLLVFGRDDGTFTSFTDDPRDGCFPHCKHPDRDSAIAAVYLAAGLEPPTKQESHSVGLEGRES